MVERGYRRRKYYIHEIQKGYAILVVILLLIYTFILTLFLFIPPAIKLFTDVPLTEKADAAAQVLVFANRLWPAVIISLFLSSLISIYATHRVAGPIYRFEQMVKKVILGDISERIRLRENDKLIYLSKLLNQMIDTIDASITDIKVEADEMEKLLDRIIPELGTEGNREVLRLIGEIAEHCNKIEASVAKFKMSSFKKGD